MTKLSHQDFAPFVGKQFNFVGHQVVLHLAVVDVKRANPTKASHRLPFTLIFHGPIGNILPEGSYRIHIENGLAVDLYIMPIHTIERDRQAYQAVFN